MAYNDSLAMQTHVQRLSYESVMKTKYQPSFQCTAVIEQLAANLKIARLRRGESEILAGKRIGVSRATYQRLEAGDPSVSVGALADAILQFGFETQLFALADPDTDEVGKRLERMMLPKKGKSHG